MSKPVLLVDDDRNSAFVVESMLDFLGVAADMAENGRVAVDKAAGADYAAILMDIEMPEMDGLDATKAIRAREAETGAAAVKVIAMTGHATTGIKMLCQMAGMDGILHKPFDLEALRDKLAEICGPDLHMEAL